MPGIDIKLYSNTDKYEDLQEISELMKSTVLDKNPASELEVMGNKAVKFMLTSIGSDALAPEYGGRSMFIMSMSREYLPKFRLEVENDLRRCTDFIKGSEVDLPAGTEKLSNIRLKGIDYNYNISPSRIDVYIEIVTTKKNKALVSFGKDVS